jgi:hypothetical protein
MSEHAEKLSPADWRLAMILIDVQRGAIGILTAVRRVKEAMGAAA